MLFIFMIFFFRAARLPAVAVGLSALLASLVLAPIPAATEPRGGVGISHSAMGVGALSPAAHLHHFIVFQFDHHSVADGRRQRNPHCSRHPRHADSVIEPAG